MHTCGSADLCGGLVILGGVRVTREKGLDPLWGAQLL